MASKHLFFETICLVILLFIIPSPGLSQNAGQDSIWTPFKFFIGSWNGKGEGDPGKGNYERTYQFIFNNKFIEINSKSTYPPTNKSPQGEVHKDIGYISYDKIRKTFVLRQFHIEGFVNQFILDSISTDGKTIVFTSEAIENIPTGWRAKEMYQIHDGEFIETFELAPPDKDFEVYTKVTLKRAK